MSTFADLLEQALAAAIAPFREEVADLRSRTEAAETKAERSEALLQAYLESHGDQVSTKEALRLSGIDSRTTLIAERQRPGTLLTYTHHGRSVTYGRAGCIAYRLAHQHKTTPCPTPSLARAA